MTTEGLSPKPNHGAKIKLGFLSEFECALSSILIGIVGEKQREKIQGQFYVKCSYQLINAASVMTIS